MKYDRPVWQIMHACADAMPEVFRYDDVRGWFVRHFPDVNEATIRAHLIGMTEGGRAKHLQFAQRSPVFRRVARGEYAPIPLAERGEDPDGPVASPSTIKMSGNGTHRAPSLPSAEVGGEAGDDADADDDPDDAGDTGDAGLDVPDVILIGSVGDRVNVPAPAKEVFRDVAFQLSRLDAELSGSEWFVLSAEHGLIAPNEWMSPDSRTLDDMDPGYRVVWATWVVARLQSLVGSIEGMIVRIDAPDTFVGPLFDGLQDAGAVVSSGGTAVAASVRSVARPVEEDDMARDDTTQDDTTRDDTTRDRDHLDIDLHDVDPDDADLDDADSDDSEGPRELAAVTSIGAMSPAATHLSDPGNAVPATAVSELAESAGVYGWVVDPIGARVLNRCLRLPIRAGLVFVGQVGGSSWHTLVDPTLTVRDHIERVQLHGRTRASTFRMTLATVLRDHLGMTSLEDPRLTEWMLEHLSISVWAASDGEGLRELAQRVIGELDPPLNVDHLPASEYRDRLHQMRSAPA